MLLEDLLRILEQDQVDYAILFRRLNNFKTTECQNRFIRDFFIDRDTFDTWSARYVTHLAKENSANTERKQRMDQTNPKFKLRNYLAKVAIYKAEDNKDYSEIDRLFTLLQHPYDEWPEYEDYANFPQEWAQQVSVSCSS